MTRYAITATSPRTRNPPMTIKKHLLTSVLYTFTEDCLQCHQDIIFNNQFNNNSYHVQMFPKAYTCTLYINYMLGLRPVISLCLVISLKFLYFLCLYYIFA